LKGGTNGMKRFSLYIQIMLKPEAWNWYLWGKYKSSASAFQAFDDSKDHSLMGPMAKVVDVTDNGTSFIG